MITAIEFKPVVRGKDIDPDQFDAICEMARDAERLGTKILSYTYTSEGFAIVPKNFVGVIGFRDGSYLEILPKITDLEDDESIENTKRIFLRMLLSIFDIPSEETGLANIDTWKNNPYEFFINMFLQEVNRIVRTGLRSDYSEIEGNECFIKGKILFDRDIRFNFHNHEKTFQSFQIYDNDCHENRLILMTLKYLRVASHDYNNIKEIHRLYPYFENCSTVKNIDDELRKCVKDRNYRHYDMAIKWCDIFLHNMSFSTFNGSEIAYTFLFPMEKIFESYVANTLKEKLSDWEVSIQNREKTLFDEGLTRSIRPDIVLRKDDVCVILDTKWKVIDSNDDISDNDLRQMKEYSADFEGRAILLYPKILFNEKTVSTRDRIIVETEYIDLLNDFDGWWMRILTTSDVC